MNESVNERICYSPHFLNPKFDAHVRPNQNFDPPLFSFYLISVNSVPRISHSIFAIKVHKVWHKGKANGGCVSWRARERERSLMFSDGRKRRKLKRYFYVGEIGFLQLSQFAREVVVNIILEKSVVWYHVSETIRLSFFFYLSLSFLLSYKLFTGVFQLRFYFLFYTLCWWSFKYASLGSKKFIFFSFSYRFGNFQWRNAGKLSLLCIPLVFI